MDIFKAARMGNAERVKYLIEKEQANVDLEDEDGETALMKASSNGQLEVVKYLVEIGKTNVDLQNKAGWTVLMIASSKGHLEVVKYLVEIGKAKVDLQNNRETALMKASLNGELEVVKYLVENGKAIVDLQDNSGETALMKACRPQSLFASDKGQLEVVIYLVEKGKANVDLQDRDGETALMKASQQGYLEVVKYLAENVKANVDFPSNSGETALMLASEYGKLEVGIYLVENGKANVDLQNNSGETALMKACKPQVLFASDKGQLEVVIYLVEKGKANVDLQNKDGETALMKASQQGYLEVVKYLVEKGKAKVDLLKKSGETALMFACYYGYLEVVKYLVENVKANVDLQNNSGETALMKACKPRSIFASDKGQLEVVIYLVENGKAKVDLQDKEDSTALMFASQQGYLEVVKYLVEKGKANVDLQNKDGFTALTYASQKGHLEIVKYLKEFTENRKQNDNNNASHPLNNNNFQAVSELASKITIFLSTDLQIFLKIETMPNFDQYIEFCELLESELKKTSSIPQFHEVIDFNSIKQRDKLRHDLIKFLETPQPKTNGNELKEKIELFYKRFQELCFRNSNLFTSPLKNDDLNVFELHSKGILEEAVKIGNEILNYYYDIKKEDKLNQFETMKSALSYHESVMNRQKLAKKCIEESLLIKADIKNVSNQTQELNKKLEAKDQELRKLCINLSLSTDDKIHCDFPEFYYEIYRLTESAEKMSELKEELLKRNLLLDGSPEGVKKGLPEVMKKLLPVDANIRKKKVADDEWKILKRFDQDKIQNIFRALLVPRRIFHPSILCCEGVLIDDDDDESVWLQYPFFKGGDLLNWLKERPPRTMMTRLKVISQILEALKVLHQNKIVHRDLKPENILMTSSDDDAIPKIADFDVAKDLSSTIVTMKSTVKGGIGTYGYMAPELLQFSSTEGSEHDYYCADVYSFAATVIVVLVFNGNLQAIPQGFDLAKGLESKCIEFEKELIPCIEKENSQALIELLKKCLSKNPKDRPKLDSNFQKLLISRFCTNCQEHHQEMEGVVCPSNQHFYCKTSFLALVKNAIETPNGVIQCYQCKQEFTSQYLASNLSPDVFVLFWSWNEKKLEARVIKELSEQLREENQRDLQLTRVELEVKQVIHYIMDDIMTSKCPKCSCGWIETEDGCRAIYCTNCKIEFCYFCNVSLGRDLTHAHVANCSLNPQQGQVYVVKHLYENFTRMRRVKLLKDYVARLRSDDQQQVRQELFRNQTFLEIIQRLNIHLGELF